jgi:hypothetical protein
MITSYKPGVKFHIRLTQQDAVYKFSPKLSG